MSNSTAPRRWHVDRESLGQWVDGLAGPLVSASVEQHVVGCADCRRVVAGLVPAATLRPAWDNVLSEIEKPHQTLAERLLIRLGVGQTDALVVGSAVTLRVGWLTGMVAILFFSVVAATVTDDGGISLFLIAAPLIPVVGVAMAYGPASDPAYEAALVAPYAMARLVLLRTAAVLATSAPMVVVAGLLLPTSTMVAVAWLLPAAGFVAVVLTASNWIDPSHAAVVVALSWIVAVAFAVRSGDPLLVFAPMALVAYVAIAAVATLTFLQRLLSKSPSWRMH